MNIITNKRKMNAKQRCTRFLILFFSLSVQSSLLFSPRISIQNEEVNAVMAPSALGKSADINAMMKITDIIAGIPSPSAIVGKSLSGLAVIPFCVAYK